MFKSWEVLASGISQAALWIRMYSLTITDSVIHHTDWTLTGKNQTRQSLASLAWKPSVDLFAIALPSACSMSVPNQTYTFPIYNGLLASCLLSSMTANILVSFIIQVGCDSWAYYSPCFNLMKILPLIFLRLIWPGSQPALMLLPQLSIKSLTPLFCLYRRRIWKGGWKGEEGKEYGKGRRLGEAFQADNQVQDSWKQKMV